MATMLRGICKGSFKYISQIFVVKEREMEIGYPTDVKHLAHIGWGGPDGTTPSWMTEFKTGSDVAMGSIVSMGGSRDPTWSSQDFEQTFGRQTSSAMLNNFSPKNINDEQKKQKQRKSKSITRSPKSSSTKSSRSSNSKQTLGVQNEGEINNIINSMKL